MSAQALVFSSDASAARVLRQALEEAELSVDCCMDAAATLDSLSTEKYSLVVLDGPDSRERDGLLRQLRCTPLNKDALAVAVLSTQLHAPAAFALGANFLLYRPLLPDRVRSSVRAAVRLIQRDKRQGRRTSVHALADVSCPAVESAPATLLDLSGNGLCLHCERSLPAQSKVYLRFTLPGQTKSVQLSGETMWQDWKGRIGIRFVDVPQATRRMLGEWLEHNLSLRESKVRVELPTTRSGLSSKPASDRRGESRHACRLGADLYRSGNDVPHRCTLTDIGVGGFYVEMTAPFPVGTPVKVVIRTKEFKFASAGTVQKVDCGFGMGVAFATQTALQRTQVCQLIKIVFRDREADGDPILKL